MPSTTINPTRMELTRLKGRLKTARRGHKLLKDKRDELMKQFMDVIRENRAIRKRVEEGLMRAHGAFTVAAALMSPEMLEQALHSPKWCLYLGRRSCVPSRPVLESVTDRYADLMDAVRQYPAPDRAQYPLQYECEQPPPQLPGMTRQDGQPAAGSRQFARRRVWRGVVARRENDVSDKD